ncbi:hypothetical protein G6F66_011249 [Rhizopus arrhizus]|nr:hypothetical protein G6F66_011249 [Rhizopus arrhizus]
MNNINNDNVENTASLPFTETQMEELYQQFAQRLRAEQDERRRGEVLDLPEEITSELNNASRSDIQSNIKKYQRDVQKYEGGDWTKSPTINKSYIQDLKRYQVDAKQVVSYRHDDSEKLRVAGRAAAEIYQELLFLTESGGDYESIQQTIEKCRRLSIYGFACSSEIDREARALAIKSLRLPQSARHLEDDEVEGDNKKMVFSADVVEQINQARYEHQIIQAEVEVSSVEANLVNGDEDLHKNLFLDEDEAWAGSLRRIPATNPTPVPTTTKLNDITSTQDTAYHGPLQHPRRWNPSGGPSSEFHSPMGTNDQSSMAIVCYQRRLPDPVEFAPYSLEISAVNSFSGRSNGSGLSCGKIFAFRDNRTITEPEQPIPVQFLHHPGANETAANPRLPEDKPVYTVQPFQDGRCTSATTIDRKRRLDLQIRPQGRICRSSYPPKFQRVFIVSPQGNNISIQVTGFRTECSTQSLFQDNAIRFGTAEDTRYEICILPRRHMSVGKIRDGNAKNDKNHSSPFDFVGFSNQLGEEYFNSKQDSRISWFPVQLKDDADYSSCSKDEEIICENTSSTREEDEQIMQVDSQFIGEDDFDDTSNRRSSTSHQIHSKGFGQEPKTQSSELGKSLSTVHRKYRRTKMVGRVLSTEKWVTHTTSFGKGAQNIDPRRRLRHRVGGKLTGNANIGLLAKVRKRKFHQCSGTKDDLLCAEDARRKIQKFDNKDPIGQHDSLKIHNKSRRYRLYRSTNISHRYTTNMQRFQPGCAVQPYTGDSEHKSRSTESIDTSSVRSGTTTPIIQHDSIPMGSSDDRRFCGKAQHKNKEVLESTSGSGCSSSGRVPPEMAEEGTLLTPTMENDPKGNSQVSTVEDQQRRIGDAILAHPILVPNDPKNETLNTTATDEHQQLDSGRMALTLALRERRLMTLAIC